MTHTCADDSTSSAATPNALQNCATDCPYAKPPCPDTKVQRSRSPIDAFDTDSDLDPAGVLSVA